MNVTTNTNPTVEAAMQLIEEYGLSMNGEAYGLAKKEFTGLRSMVEALAVDAERYRWLRAVEDARVYVRGIDSIRRMGESLDTAIDAAIADAHATGEAT